MSLPIPLLSCFRSFLNDPTPHFKHLSLPPLNPSTIHAFRSPTDIFIVHPTPQKRSRGPLSNHPTSSDTAHHNNPPQTKGSRHLFYCLDLDTRKVKNFKLSEKESISLFKMSGSISFYDKVPYFF